MACRPPDAWSASATTSLAEMPYRPDRLSTGRSPMAPGSRVNAPTGSLTTMPSTPWSTSSRSEVVIDSGSPSRVLTTDIE